MNERIKRLRKVFNLTQQEFAQKIGTHRNNIAGYETGKRSPSEAIISLICREFHVSETWLRTGEGEMFVQTVDDPVKRLCTELHATSLDAEIIRAYFKIDPRIRESFMEQIIRELRTSPPAKPDADEQEEADFEAQARAKAELYYQQLLSEQEQARQVPSAKESGTA